MMVNPFREDFADAFGVGKAVREGVFYEVEAANCGRKMGIDCREVDSDAVKE